MIKKIRSTILVSILVGLILGIGLYYIWQTDQKKQIPRVSTTIPEAIQKPSQDESIYLTRQEAMKDIAEKINKISPIEPVLGGNWHVLRFWFVRESNHDVYVEYEDGHIIRQLLILVEGTKEAPEYKVIAYFEPGQNNWVLKNGKDTQFGKLLDLYEYDKNTDEWIKKN